MQYNPGGYINRKPIPVIVLIYKGEVIIPHHKFDEYVRGLDTLGKDGVE